MRRVPSARRWSEGHTRLCLLQLAAGSAGGGGGVQRGRGVATRASAANGRKLRVLALHGYGQTSESFRRKSGALRKAVKGDVEFTFLDAPLVAPPRSELANDNGGLAWWHWDAADGAKGWRESLAHILHHINSQNEDTSFDGLLGFSQGASMVGMVLNELRLAHSEGGSDSNRLQSISFAAMVSGFVPRSPEQRQHMGMNGKDQHMSMGISVDTWHSFGMSDQIIPEAKSRELVELMHRWSDSAAAGASSGNVVVSPMHSGGHLVSSQAPIRNSFKSFCQAQRGKLMK